MKKRALVFAFLFLFFLVSEISFVFSDVSVSKLETLNKIKEINKISNKIQPQVFTELENKDSVKVIITIKENSDSRTIKTQSQEELRETIIKSIGNEKIKHKFSSSNSFSANLNQIDLAELINNDNIKSVYYDFPTKLSLQDSVIITNASYSWGLNINNLNFTGQGETVCVIDSGINYSHPGLGGCFGDGCKVIGGYDYGDSDNNPMDYEGHGTHVAGIVAANSTILGMSPNSNLVALKVFGDDGSGSTSMVISAIDWCVDNNLLYNISVITISLGLCEMVGPTCVDILRSSYCDSEFSSLSSSINAAVTRNISVLVASGNNENSTSIGVPACIQNATPIGSSTKSDLISFFSNRNNLVSLFAPGGDGSLSGMINSTCIPGESYYDSGYCRKQGTSMATPHVAGTIAIIRQYLALTNKTRTPKQIEIILNNTGKRIYDSGSGLTFSRIDLYSAILSLDETSPNTNLTSPLNSSSTRIVNQTFTANITDDLQLKNTTFYLWNSTSSLVNSNFSLLSDINQQVSFNVTNLDYTTYTWNFYSCDINNNCSFSQSNFSLSISSLVSNISIPENNTRTNQLETNFTCNSTSTQDFSLINNTFFLWNSTSLVVYSETKNISGTINSSIFNISLDSFGDNVYYWNCLSTNNASVSSYSDSNFTIIYDSTPPELNIINLENNTWYNKINFNISLNEESDSCWFSLNNQDNLTMNKFNLTYFYYSNLSNQTDTNLANNITIYCNDTVGNINTSSLISFGIDLISPNITLISPENSYSETISTKSINFQFNISDNLNISECILIINNEISLTNNSIVNQSKTHQFTKTLSPGSYTWYINCTDEAGNQANSSLRSITLIAPTIGGNTGSSGGSSRTISNSLNFLITPLQIQQGFTYPLSINDSIRFEIKNNSHNITINSIYPDMVNVIIRSSPIIINLSLGEERKLNLTNNESFDFYIKLNSINNNKANITLLEINEKIPVDVIVSNETETKESLNLPKKNNILFILIVLSLIVIVYIINEINNYRLYLKDKKNKNDKKQETKTKK